MSRSARSIRQLSAVLLLGLALAHCGSKDKSSPTAPVIPPDFALSASPASLSILAGGSDQASIAVSRSGDASAAVALVVSGTPAGVTATLSPAQVPAGSGSMLSVTVGASATPGTYTITVGGACGSASHQVTVSLEVRDPGGFTLAASPTALAMRVGASATTAISIARTAPFAGAVALSVSGAPAGVTAVFDQATIGAGGTGAVLTVSAAQTATPGTYGLTVRGTGTGVSERTVALSLTVSPQPTYNLQLQFCDTARVPIWFAAQDGTAAWAQVIGDHGTFRFNITSGKGAIAFVYGGYGSGGAGYSVTIVYASQAEFTEVANVACLVSSPRKRLTGTVAGITAADFVAIGLGAGYADIYPGQGTSFTMPDAGTGVRDLIAAATRTGGAQQPDRVIIRRGTNYPAGSAIPVLDFASPEAFAAPLANTVAVTGYISADQLFFSEYYVTASSAGALPLLHFPGYTSARYLSIPPADTATGDVYNVRVDEIREEVSASRAVATSFNRLTDLSLSLGGQIPAPTTFTLATTPNYQVRVFQTLPMDYNKLFVGSFAQPDRQGELYVSTGWTGGGNIIDVSTPNLATLPGWQSTWGPRPGIVGRMTASAYGWTGPLTLAGPLFQADAIILPGVTVRTSSTWRNAAP